MAQLFKAMLLSNKREQTANACHKADAIPMHYAKCICYLCACGRVQLCPVLCDSVDSSPPGFSVHEMSQARILKWVATSSSRGLLDPEMESVFLASLALAGRFFTN